MILFGKNLKTLITKLAISQASIEAVVDKRQTTISNWINGKTSPDAEDLVKLSDFFGVAIDDLCLTDLSRGSLISESYVSNFRAKGSLKGSLKGSPKVIFHQNIGEEVHQESGEIGQLKSLLWSVLKLLEGIDSKLDRISTGANSGNQKNG
jgi:transcriptional regulator with XRE-family HTH domain